MTEITFTYTNWRGETSIRTAVPISLRYGTSEWHKEPRWLMTGRDTEKNAEREFAVRDMLLITPEQAVLSFVDPARDDVEQTCEHCSKDIKEGDLYFPFEDGPLLCADCSPTWGDAESMHRTDRAIGEDEEMRERRLDFSKRLQDHLAAGGSKTDKLPLTPL